MARTSKVKQAYKHMGSEKKSEVIHLFIGYETVKGYQERKE